MDAVQEWYVRGGAYRMNRAVRGEANSMDARERKLARRFIAMFDEIEPLAEPMRLYRGIGAGSYLDQQGQYLSTSESWDIADSFTREDLVRDAVSGRMRAVPAGEVLILDVQPGVRVMHIGGVQREWVIEADVELTETRRSTGNSRTDRSTRIWVTVTRKETRNA